MAGLLAFVGLAGTKFAGNLIAKGIAKLSAGSSAAPPPASGLGAISAMASPLGALLAGGLGIAATMKFVTDESKRTPLVLGQVCSVLHSIAVAALGAINPGAASVLSGDDTAVRLAAMYGMGGGTSIMPYYAPVNGGRGVGEYFQQRGVGEYLTAQNGLGEYFESGVEGLGNYVGNVDIAEAAAGYGASETSNTNHIDPSSDLERELTIAEAAAGVGSAVYQAAAGMRGLPPYAAQAGGVGEYFSSGVNGLGNVGLAPSANTWIPGMSDPSLWAGTRAVNETQEATAMISAGVLQSGGNQGVFG